MAIVTLSSFGADPVSITGPGLDAKVDPLATDYNGNIQNVNIAAGAGIVYSKLNLTGNIVYADFTTTAFAAMTQPINFNKGTNIASASTADIGAATGNVVDVTGTVTITALGTIQAGTLRWVRFTGILTLTHNATSLILPGGVSIITANGDRALFESLGSGNWICLNYVYTDKPSFSAHKNGSNQTGIVSGVATKLTYGTELWDTNSNFASSTFTPTVKGLYRISSAALWTVGVDQTVYQLVLYKNGSSYRGIDYVEASGTGAVGNRGSTLVSLNGSTDYVEIFAIQSSGGDKIIDGTATNTYFDAEFVRSI